MPDCVSAFLEGAFKGADRNELSTYFKKFMSARYGFSIIGYFLLTDHGIHTYLKDSIRFHNYPEPYMQDYLEHRRDRSDPILKEAHRSNCSFRWSELEKARDLSSDEKTFVEALRTAGIKDGISAPVFAKPGRLAHIGLTGIGKDFPFSQLEMHTILMICQEYHRLYEAFERVEADYQLSRKETVVMSLISQGRSNIYIARELGISPHTVDTLVRRCFLKLHAKNRTDAVIRALNRNLICFAD